LARRTPRGPEVEEHDLAAERAQREPLAPKTSDGKVERLLLAPRPNEVEIAERVRRDRRRHCHDEKDDGDERSHPASP
ncbi:MAG: hypothetical protein ACRDHF_02940, partial [Tepidiformaceae bacterium]